VTSRRQRALRAGSPRRTRARAVGLGLARGSRAEELCRDGRNRPGARHTTQPRHRSGRSCVDCHRLLGSTGCWRTTRDDDVTLRRTSSAASAGRRSGLPSAERHSMIMFFPSTYPSSRRPRRNASMRATLAEGALALRYPIRGTVPACSASPVSDAARTLSANVTRRSVCLMRHLQMAGSYARGRRDVNLRDVAPSSGQLAFFTP
jgi:hypothetical protein